MAVFLIREGKLVLNFFDTTSFGCFYSNFFCLSFFLLTQTTPWCEDTTNCSKRLIACSCCWREIMCCWKGCTPMRCISITRELDELHTCISCTWTQDNTQARYFCFVKVTSSRFRVNSLFLFYLNGCDHESGLKKGPRNGSTWWVLFQCFYPLCC